MYALPATPMPLPFGRPSRFASQPVAWRTAFRHSPRPMVVMRRSFTVRLFAGCRTRSRYSIGSRPRSVAILSSWHSNAYRGCVVPCPRFRPHRKERRRELVTERIALAAEGPTVRRRDDADVRARKLEHLLELAVHVVGDLGRRPERELPVTVVRGDARVRLDRRVGVALEERPVVTDEIGRRETALEVAEREMDLLEDVRAARVLVDPRVLATQRLLDGEDQIGR